jgi:capsular polysaccharide export protein
MQEPERSSRRLPNRVFAYGFSFNKRRFVRRFAAESTVHFVRTPAAVPPGSTLLLWGSSPVPKLIAGDVDVVRVEDGFLRSVGLGAELTRPLSWVMDGEGIYYDATVPSDLEHLLQTLDTTPQLVARAARLRSLIVASGITKYCVGVDSWQRPAGQERVILVPGQVETDASIRFGAAGIRDNFELVRAVREANPDAYVVHKPHPDVVAGLRLRGDRDFEARAWSDEIVTDVSMSEMLKRVDEVHVMTSLAGFEALLREKTVVCYGHPFYAGWGLTRDVVPLPRRTRRLTLDELVAGALIAYPRYVSRSTQRLTSPEQVLEELVAWRTASARRNRPWQGVWRAVLRMTVGRA